MRVAVVDIGTNSTRLLLADVSAQSAVEELERRTTITRLGQGVDASGALADEAMDRVFAALDAYRAAVEAHGGADRSIAVLTSAVRDAANGQAFTARSIASPTPTCSWSRTSARRPTARASAWPTSQSTTC
jgi:exopolyphosphatase / guanosine-5'-triphosphate,3'-diphosphate pyrophosphatase